VGKCFQEAQAQWDNFVEKKQFMFQEEMVNSANAWMREQQNARGRQAMSVQMWKGRLAVLEQAPSENYDFDLENDVVMRAPLRTLCCKHPLFTMLRNWQSTWLTQDMSPF